MWSQGITSGVEADVKSYTSKIPRSLTLFCLSPGFFVRSSKSAHSHNTVYHDGGRLQMRLLHQLLMTPNHLSEQAIVSIIQFPQQNQNARFSD
jgi:hypothetical protein